MSLIFEVINPTLAGLADSFSVNPDSCENPAFYKDYLRWIAYSDYTSGENTTHVLYDDEENEILGFIALRATAVVSKENVEKGKPALEISVLAVNQKYERQGIGSALIDFAMVKAKELHENVLGINNIVLVSDKKAVGFYKKRKFFVVSDYMDVIPRVSWNETCIPMIMRLDFWEGESYATDDDDDDDQDF